MIHEYDDADALIEDVVAFCRALSEPRRREYERLAELDRRFGEDVARENERSSEGAS